MPIDDIIFNVNMDMIGTNSDYRMYAGGTHYTRELKPILNKVWSGRRDMALHYGYDIPRTVDDRTFRSDHAVFHVVGIPFLYFGVPEHLNYHQPTDDYQNISHGFYYNGVNLILKSIVSFDREFPVIKRRKAVRN